MEFLYGWVNGKSWNSFTSTPVLQQPLDTEWYSTIDLQR